MFEENADTRTVTICLNGCQYGFQIASANQRRDRCSIVFDGDVPLCNVIAGILARPLSSYELDAVVIEAPRMGPVAHALASFLGVDRVICLGRETARTDVANTRRMLLLLEHAPDREAFEGMECWVRRMGAEARAYAAITAGTNTPGLHTAHC